MAFIKKIEDFTCGNCGQVTVGNGFTNHCEKCLWSKHVDDEPGDRAQACGGLMRPIDIYYKGQNWIISHRCETCGHVSNDKVRDEDDVDAVIRLQKEIADKKMKRA